MLEAERRSGAGSCRRYQFCARSASVRLAGCGPCARRPVGDSVDQLSRRKRSWTLSCRATPPTPPHTPPPPGSPATQHRILPGVLLQQRLGRWEPSRRCNAAGCSPLHDCHTALRRWHLGPCALPPASPRICISWRTERGGTCACLTVASAPCLPSASPRICIS
eukprot:120904-Chlamydomonas_euryale.AAC.1